MNSLQRTEIEQHLDEVIRFYEEYTNDLLKEHPKHYKENIIDLKETGYEYRLELDKILVEVEEELV